MAFEPAVNDVLNIDDVTYRVAEHPAAPGIPYGQQGRQATVFSLLVGSDRRALKVLKPPYRSPSIVTLAKSLEPFADIPGLDVCRRLVLTDAGQRPLLTLHPDLAYASLMPWVEGPTWMEVMMDKRPLSSEASLRLARGLASLLAQLEARNAAHCDLSAANVLLPALAPAPLRENGRRPRSDLALVDVEQLYAPALPWPDAVPAGSPGYGHETATRGVWRADGDRFAGAVLIAEFAGWCDTEVRDAAWGESYFDPAEIGRTTSRSQMLSRVLRERWGGDVAALFGRAWSSKSLAECAPFQEWLSVLGGVAGQQAPESTTHAPGAPEPGGSPSDSDEAAYALLAMGRGMEARGNLPGALETYRQALSLAPRGGKAAAELQEAVRVLSAHGSGRSGTPRAGNSTDPRKPFDWVDDRDFSRLLRDGQAAYIRGDFDLARQLLETVARSRPGYQVNGETAERLLAAIEKATGSPQGTRRAAPDGGRTGGGTHTWKPDWTAAAVDPRSKSAHSQPPPRRSQPSSPQPPPTANGGGGGPSSKAVWLWVVVILVVVLTLILLAHAGGGNSGGQSSRPPAAADVIDNFQDPARSLLSDASPSDGSYRLAHVDGEFSIARTSASYGGLPSAFLPGQYANTSLIADAYLVGPTSGRYVAMACRRQPGGRSSEYRFAVDPAQGTFSLSRWDDGSEVPLQPWHASAAIRHGDQPNEFALSCVGSTIAATINRVPVASIQDGTYTNGKSWIGAGVFPNFLPGVSEARFTSLELDQR